VTPGPRTPVHNSPKLPARTLAGNISAPQALMCTKQEPGGRFGELCTTLGGHERPGSHERPDGHERPGGRRP